MKKRKKVLWCVLAVAFLLCSIILFFGNSTNKCYKYTKEYLGNMPDDELMINAINESTKKFLNEKTFDNYVFFSKYLKRFFVDKFIYHLDDRMGDEAIITSYYNEIVVLQLKTYLINGEEQNYKELFYKTFDSLDTCWLYTNYLTDLVKDKNYPIVFGDIQYQIIENTYNSLLDNEDNELKKYFINESMLRFYSVFEETERERFKCRELREELIDEIGDGKIKEEVLKRNGLNSFTDSLNSFKW